MKRTALKKRKTKNLPLEEYTKSQLVEELDKVFSLFIRHRDGYKCVTCPATGDQQQMQCGHYIPRGNMNTRWDEENCHCQCMPCNVFKKGNMDEYALFITRKFGPGFLEELKKRKNTIKQWSKQELINKIRFYRELIQSIIN